MNITATDVNNLRKRTGAGMMDCKKALVEANGDFEAAIDILRKRGQKVAANRSDRDAAEGLVIAKTTNDGKNGVMIVLNCETDFVAKNEDFGNMANTILEVAINNSPANLEALMSLPYSGNGLSIGDKIIEQTGVIGEKIELSGYELINAEMVVAYNHPGNKLASMVGLNKNGNFADAGRDVAMQIAAMAPVAVNKDEVDQSVIDREIEVGKDLAIQEGKPADMAEKIAMGRLNKFFKENTLLSQDFVKDNKKTIAQYLSEFDKDLTVTGFKRIALSV
jgi:elongation factor Ts